MILIEEKYKAVPKNYKGIVRLKPTIARFRPCLTNPWVDIVEMELMQESGDIVGGLIIV